MEHKHGTPDIVGNVVLPQVEIEFTIERIEVLELGQRIHENDDRKIADLLAAIDAEAGKMSKLLH